MRLNNFDLLRLFAALQVLYCHTCFHLDVTTGLGDPRISYFINWFPGVPIFFTISGFLISRSWERSCNWRTYAMNRILRIYPALWAQLAVGILMLFCFGAITPAVVTRPSFFVWIAAQASFAQFYSAQFLRDFGIRALNGSLWTIPVELGFYVILPILYFGFVNRVRRIWADLGLGLMSLVSFSYWFYLLQQAESENFWLKLQQVSPLPYLHMFLVGVLLQRHFERLRPLLENRALLWLGAFSLFMLTFNPWGQETISNEPVRVVVGRLLLATTALSFAFSWHSLSERLLRGNDISYGVYLYHAFGILTLNQLDWKGSSWCVVAVALSTIILATLSWRLIEKPAVSRKPQHASDPKAEPVILAMPASPAQPKRRAA